MAIPINTDEGQVVAEFSLILPDAKLLPFGKTIAEHFSSTINETVFGMSQCYHSFTTYTPAVVDKILRAAMADGTPTLSFRLGVITERQKFFLPWQQHVVASYSGILEGGNYNAGHRLEISSADHLWYVDGENRIAVHKGKISDIVTKIATANGLKDSVVEPTLGDAIYYQSMITDYQFIKDRLLPRAINKSGRGNYLFFIRDNVLHFHSPDYQADVKELAYFKLKSGGLNQTDHSQVVWDEGASGVRVIAYDPYTGQFKNVESSADKALRFAQSSYKFDRATNNIGYHLSTNGLAEAEAIAQSKYEQQRMGLFKTSITFKKSLGVRAGDIVRFAISPAQEKASPWGGTYLVGGLTHLHEKGSLETNCKMMRGELMKSLTNVVVAANQRLVVPETEAPGQDLNLKETASSILTKGAGDEIPGSTIATVKDPNSA